MSFNIDVFGKEAIYKQFKEEYSKRTDENGKLILQFVKSKSSDTHPRALAEYFQKLGLLDKLLEGKLFKELDAEDVLDLIDTLRARKGRKGGMNPRTLNNYKLALRTLLKYIGKPDLAALAKNQRLNELNDYTPDDLLTDEDYGRLLRAANNPRDKAIIAVNAEAGPRPMETINMQVKDVNLTTSPKSLILFGKGKKRYRPIVGCIPHLADWLNKHPNGKDPEAPLWVNRMGKPMNYPAVKRMIERTFKRAKIRKPARLEIFRHTVNTWAYANLPGEIAAPLCGHVLGSRAYKAYIHLSKTRVANKYMSAYGVLEIQPEIPPMAPKVCRICDFMNPSDNLTCSKCKNSLTLKDAIQLMQPDPLLQTLIEQPELPEEVEKKIFEIVDRKVQEWLDAHRTTGGDGPAEI